MSARRAARMRVAIGQRSLPGNEFFAVCGEIGVGAGKVAAAEKTAISRKRRGVDGREDQMALLVDKRGFLLRVAAPEQEDEPAALGV